MIHSALLCKIDARVRASRLAPRASRPRALFSFVARERRERAAAKADEEFALGFLMAARQVFDTMDKDGEGIIDKSVCDNAMSATKAKFDAKASGTVTLADGRVVPASSVPPGTKLQGGATMPAPVPMVTLADGRVMPMDKVPPGTELADGSKMPRGETVMLADGTIVAKKDAPPGAALAGGGSMAVDETATVTLADGTVVLAKDVAPGTPLADGQVMAPRAGQMVTLADGTVCDAASVLSLIHI